jgi:hypothetical protein
MKTKYYKIILNSIAVIFWIWLISEKYEKIIIGDSDALIYSLLFIVCIVISSYQLIKAIKNKEQV